MNKPAIDLTDSKVLIVDDIPENLDILSRSLEDQKYNVLVATNGEMALEVAVQTKPDVILLDVMMPGIDGFETCRRMKADPELSEIPVVFLTAWNELEGLLEGFRAGGVDYITKPFQKEEVLIRLRTHLERAKLAEKLGFMNAQLEQMVAERTEQLQQKVNELEGKDRIAQHLLTYHALDETLALILEVISEVTGVDRAVVHLKEEDAFKAEAGIGISDAGGIATPEQLDQLDLSALEEAFATVQERREPVQVDGQVLVPILRGDDFLGLIQVDNRTVIESQTLETVESFALQAAVAISDAQVQMDAGRWKDQLEDVFKLDEVITEVDQLDDLAGGSKG